MSEEKDLMKRATALVVALRDCGILWAGAHFDGSGDSGMIEFLSAWTQSEHPAAMLEYAGQEKPVGMVEFPEELKEEFESVMDGFLEMDGTDWYNNDGGFGDILLNVKAGNVELEMNTRYTDFNSSTNSWEVPLPPEPKPTKLSDVHDVKPVDRTKQLKSRAELIANSPILGEVVKETKKRGAPAKSRDIV